MHPVFELAKKYNVAIHYDDLGEWGVDELRSEYDPDGPAIRINKRVIENLPLGEIGDFVAFSIAHEIYHHRERLGEVPQLRDRASRETAANDFARELCGAAPPLP
jgi:hypothetical protein